MNTWKAIILGCLLLPSLNHAYTFINQIGNFTQLVQSVESGFSIRAIIRLNRCSLTNPDIQDEVDKNLDFATSGFDFTDFFHTRVTFNEQLLDAVTTFRKIYIENSSGELLTLFSWLSVFENNTARLHVIFFDPVLHKKRLVADWICNFNDVPNGFQNNIIQANFQSNIQANFQDVPTNLQNNLQTNLQSNLPSNLPLNTQPFVNNNLVNTSQYPLKTNFQGDSGLVLFNVR